MFKAQLINQYNTTREISQTEILCYAPFTSLNFEQNGKMTVCCYNRTHVLGHYPTDSIKESWFGAKAKELRAAIQRMDFSKGCKVCLDQLTSKNFYGMRARHFDQYAAGYRPEKKHTGFLRFERFDTSPQMPKVMEFELSNLCNLECIMCNGTFSSGIRRHKEKLPPVVSPYEDHFLEQLEEFIPNLSDAKFLGGEPFLIDIYYKIWMKIAECNPAITIHITTNGTILTPKVKQLLERLQCGIILSIDSLQKETYERIRPNASFEKVMENFQYFREYTRRKETWLSFAVCPITQNWYEIPEMITFCNQHNLSLCFNTVFKPEQHSLRFLPAFILEQIVAYYESVNPASETFYEKYNRQCFLDLINQLKRWLSDRDRGEKSSGELKRKFGELFTSGRFQHVLEREEHQLPTQVITRALIRYFLYKRESRERASAMNGVDALNSLIEQRDVLLRGITTCKEELGRDDFLKCYLDALSELNSLIYKGRKIQKFRKKTTHIYRTILGHPRKDVIIDEIYWLDPIHLLKMFTYVPLKGIQKNYHKYY